MLSGVLLHYTFLARGAVEKGEHRKGGQGQSECLGNGNEACTVHEPDTLETPGHGENLIGAEQ